MSKHPSDDSRSALSETHPLAPEPPLPDGEEFSLESILAEFGHGAAEISTASAETTPEEIPEIPPEEAGDKVPDTAVPPDTVQSADVLPAEDPSAEAADEAPAAGKPDKTLPRRGKILSFPGRFFHTEQSAQSEPNHDGELTDADASADSENVSPAQPEASSEEASAPKSIPEDTRLSLEDVMAQTVDAVLEEENDVFSEEKLPFGEQIGFIWANLCEKCQALLSQFLPAGRPSGQRAHGAAEMDMEQARREAKRTLGRLTRQLLFSAIPLVLLLALTAADTWWPQVLPAVWQQLPLLRCGLVAALLLLTCVLSSSVWRTAVRALKQRHMTYEAAAALPVLAVLGDCLYGAYTGQAETLPLGGAAAMAVWLCLLGQQLRTKAQHDAFRLADLGGQPPYTVSLGTAGACKQKGRLRGFYQSCCAADPAQISAGIFLPLLLAITTVLSGVVCIGGQRPGEFLHVWSVMLCVSLPAGLPLCGALSVRCLQGRLSRSGCAIGGYTGARDLSSAKRIVLTDSDLFPPGTVSLNGLKIYGEEIGKVVSYAATAAKAAGSQLQPIFEQLLASEGGAHCPYDDLFFYEEGGVGITIRGESVTMGSAYFMKKHHVRLPQELKIKTGVFLAVDGQLIAIFAIKYQASRNVECALRTLRRSRIEPVLAVRSGNLTPSFLKKKFGVDARPVYPDVSTRLALSDLSAVTADGSTSILYRDGLAPFVETVVGSRRCCRVVRWSTLLCWLGSLFGVLLSYYLMDLAAYHALSAGYAVIYLLLWLLPAILLGDLTRRY